MEHLQERMTCRDAQLEACAKDIRDLVTKGIEMALIRYSAQVNTFGVRPQPDWLLQQIERAGDKTGQADNEHRERLMVRRRTRILQL